MTSPAILDSARRLGFTHVVLASSHTHSGPNADDADFPGQAAPWRGEMEKRVDALLRRALEATFEARLSVAQGRARVAHNRRLVAPDGEVTMLWRNAEERPTHPLDPTLTVLRVSDLADRTRGADRAKSYTLRGLVLERNAAQWIRRMAGRLVHAVRFNSFRNSSGKYVANGSCVPASSSRSK